jgi:hypothetical protein
MHFYDFAVVGISLAGSFAVAVVVQKTALGFLLSCMGCSPHDRREAREKLTANG